MGAMFSEATPVVYSSCPANHDIWVQYLGYWRNRERPPKSLLKPLQKGQTACLRSITGGYKRRATALLEKEANIPPPLQLYIESTAMQRAQKERNSNVTECIKTRLNKLWRDPRTPPRRRINQ